MYVVYKKESFTEDDSVTVFTNTYIATSYDKAVLLAANEVLKFVIENNFLHKYYSAEDLSYLLSENPDKVLTWLIEAGSDFFKSFNLDFQIWVHLETQQQETVDEISFEDWLDTTKNLQRRLLGETQAEA